MLNIMKADLYRIIRGKGIYITFAILLALNIIGVASASLPGMTFATVDEYGVPIADVAPLHEMEWNGQNMALMLTTSMENMAFFLLPFIVFVSAAMFTHGTVKNDIAWGISRSRLFISKLILCTVLCAALLLFYMVCGMLLATFINGFGGATPPGYWSNLFQTLGLQFILLFAFICIGNFLVFVSQRTAVVNGAYIAFCLVPPLLISLLLALNQNLVRLFDFDMLSNIMLLGDLHNAATQNIITAIGTGVFWIVVSLVGGLVLFRKAEIK